MCRSYIVKCLVHKPYVKGVVEMLSKTETNSRQTFLHSWETLIVRIETYTRGPTLLMVSLQNGRHSAENSKGSADVEAVC